MQDVLLAESLLSLVGTKNDAVNGKVFSKFAADLRETVENLGVY
jgi:hypothetical protein